MYPVSSPPNTIKNAVIRTTALWAASEAFLGGFLHAFRVPMAGVFLAAFASICITTIALSSQKRGTILNATFVVIAIKFILSPHTPVMAYLAVALQGLAGELFFIRRKSFKWPAFALSVFCPVYSALQHLLVLTILLGMGFWEALNQFLNNISQSFGLEKTDYVGYIIGFYMGGYLISGIVAALINIGLIKSIKEKQIPEYVETAHNMKTQALAKSPKRGQRFKRALVPVGIFSAAFLLVTYIPFFENRLASHKLLLIAVRSLFIIAVWLLAVAPLLKKLINWSLQRKNIFQSNYFKSVLQLLPEMQLVIQKSWSASKTTNKLRRAQRFVTACFMLALFYD